MTTLEELTREVHRLERVLDGRVSEKLYRSEMGNLKEDVNDIKIKVDRMMENQITSQRAQIAQLVMIIATLAVAAWGAIS